MPANDLNTFQELKYEQIKVEIQAIYTLLHHKNVTWPIDDKTKNLLLKTLKEQGLEPETKDKRGATLLHYTAWAGHKELLEILISLSFDPNASYDDMGLLESALDSGNIELLHFLIEKGVKPKNIDVLWEKAISSGNIKILQLLIEKGIKLHDRHFKSAILKNNKEVFYFLIQIGPKLNTQEYTILFATIKCGNIKMFETLLAIGFDKNASHDASNTLLSFAAHRGQYDFVKLLISKYGLKPDPKLLKIAATKTTYKCKEVLDLCLDENQLNALYNSFLNSFVLREINENLPATIPEDPQKLEEIILRAVKLRQKVLEPLLDFCNYYITNNEAKKIWTDLSRNNLAAGQKLEIHDLEKQLDDLLARPSQAYTNSLRECRLRSAKITGNAPRMLKNDSLLVPNMNLQFKEELKAAYSFQFKLLYACATLSTVATLILGILAIATFHPVVAAIAITASTASLLASSYGFYNHSRIANKSNIATELNKPNTMESTYACK